MIEIAIIAVVILLVRGATSVAPVEGTMGTSAAKKKVNARTVVTGDLKTVWRNYDHLFQTHAIEFGVNWKWLKAIALNESDLGLEGSVKRGLASSDGLSYGLMQVTVKTGKSLLGGWPSDAEMIPILNDADQSIWLAAKLLKELRGLVAKAPGGATMKNIIVSYNQSYARTVKGEILPAAETYWERFEVHLDLVEKNP